jgi:molybdopterin/thiamine biosynthesis adenylyltransferase
MKQILIIGAGGIGSWLTFMLSDLTTAGKQLKNIELHIADDDYVDTGNIRYQKFNPEDIGDPKVGALKASYPRLVAEGLQQRIDTKEQLNPYDCVVLAVDNTKTRRLVFENFPKHWIDLRSEGREIAAFCKSEKNPKEKMLATLPKEVVSGSCQRPGDLEKGLVQNGNKIVAAVGVQMILNWSRGELGASEVILSI